MAIPEWLTSMIPFVKDAKTWEILQQHVLLLTAQRDDAIALLEKTDLALAEAKEQITGLQDQVDDLKKEIERLQPVGDLSKEAIQILQTLFIYDNAHTPDSLADGFGWEIGVVKYHGDVLKQLDFLHIRRRALSAGRNYPDEYVITSEGRAYIVKNGLIPDI